MLNFIHKTFNYNLTEDISCLCNKIKMSPSINGT